MVKSTGLVGHVGETRGRGWSLSIDMEVQSHSKQLSVARGYQRVVGSRVFSEMQKKS